MKTASSATIARSWDDIVFENRNQAYGAYVLRKLYSRRVLIGLLITAVFLALVLASPWIMEQLKGKEEKTAPPPRKMVYTDLSAPPPIDKPKPPPPQIQLPKLQKVIKFVPPKVVKEEVVEEIPTIEEIKQVEVAAEAVEGTGDIVWEEPVEQVVIEEPDENKIFMVVEQQPEFEGGYAAMMAFIKKNMRYPASARRMGIEGTVYLSFVVGKDGSINDVQVLRGISADCDKEAVRVVQSMPNWKPGKQNGKPVLVRFNLPIRFQLN